LPTISRSSEGLYDLTTRALRRQPANISANDDHRIYLLTSCKKWALTLRKTSPGDLHLGNCLRYDSTCHELIVRYVNQRKI